MKKTAASLLVCFLLLLSCVGGDLINDYVDPDLRISNPIVSINEGFQYQFKARFFDTSTATTETATSTSDTETTNADTSTTDTATSTSDITTGGELSLAQK